MRKLIKLVAPWWCKVDERSGIRLFRLCITYLSLWMTLAILGIDRLTAENTFFVLPVALLGVAGFIGAILGARAWVGSKFNSSRVKHENRANWIGSVLFFTLMPAAMLGGSTYLFTGIIAQQLPGVIFRLHGTVTNVRHVGTPSALCRVRLAISLEESRRDVAVCLVASGGTPVGPLGIREGDNVVIAEKRNAFGSVIESVTYAGDQITPGTASGNAE